MPLDPLPALSIAASLVQFIDFSAKIVSKGNRLFQSASGSLLENDQIESAAKRLRDLVQPIQPPPLATADDIQEQPLQDLCTECVKVATQLMGQLEELKVPDGCSHRRWKSIRQALKSVWSKDRLDEMQERLRSLDEQLKTHILILLRYLLYLKIPLALLTPLISFLETK
jgi:hypothetical protein